MAKLDVVGVAEVSELLGVSKARVRQLARARAHGFPEPAAQLAAGPIWERSDIASWKLSWPRRTGRPPRRGAPAAAIPALIDALRAALATVEGVEEAFLFGSFAKGTEGRESDVDVFVVGKPDWTALTIALEPIERRWRREVHVTSMRRADFEERKERGSGFLTAVLTSPTRPILDREDKPR